MATTTQPQRVDVEALLIEVADVLNTTLDLDTLLQRVAEVVKRVIDYEIFSILLLNERAQELRFRFQIGHLPEVAERIRVKVGEGVTGRAVQERRALLVDDVSKDSDYIEAVPRVRSELAVPLINKNRVIGVMDLEAKERAYFKEEHARLLTLIASRIAVSIENARLYTRIVRQAGTLALLNEISRDLTSILNVDQLLKRIGDLLLKVIDYHMFSILLLDSSKQKLVHRFSVRFKENVQIKHDIPVGRGLVGAAAQSKKPVLAPDVARDPRYIKANPETRSELCVPLIYKDEVIGVLDLEHTRRGYFTDDH
jgi:sigma-B regulation protein RsbU (phosphoserine phosphatase)